ncbi:MAG: nitric oxide reductase activation protein NorD, partial [Gemmatimonadaceae bacterium]
ALAGRARTAGPALVRARAAALRERPSLRRPPPTEREVERLVRAALAAAPDAPPAELPADGGPDASLHWAREAAARVRAAVPTIGGYRGVTPVALWGTVPDAVARPSGGQGLVQEDASPGEGGERGPEPPPAPNDGAAGDANDDATARGERPTPAPGSDADAAGDGGRAVPPSVTLDPVDAASRVVDDPFAQRHEQADLERGITYPEWDCWAGTYRREGARVVDRAAAEGNGEWAARVLREHASLARTVRHRFERLRARRARLGRQRDGEELDLDACVRALVERRAGGTPGDDLYVCVRPARRALAVALLVDASGSTDAPVAGERRVIDVEREAVLLAAEALDALGDPYAVLSFSGRGARGVGVTALKTFGEHTRGALARRVGEVAPASNTRLGAAVRHAASLLARQPAGHRLLLLLSDGKPNDADGYVDRYAVEDSRRAVQEARGSGIVTHCLTVDQEEPEYLAHVFGAAGYTILRRPEALPTALVGVVRQLLGRGA